MVSVSPFFFLKVMIGKSKNTHANEGDARNQQPTQGAHATRNATTKNRITTQHKLNRIEAKKQNRNENERTHTNNANETTQECKNAESKNAKRKTQKDEIKDS